MLGAKWKTVRAEEKKNLIRRYTMLRKKLICKWLQRKKLKLRQWGCWKMNKSRGLWWNCLNNTCNSNKRKKKMARRTSYIYLPFDHSSYLGGYWCLLKKCSQEREGPSKPKHHIPAYFLFTNDRRAALIWQTKNKHMSALWHSHSHTQITVTNTVVKLRKKMHNIQQSVEQLLSFPHKLCEFSRTMPEIMDQICNEKLWKLILHVISLVK